MTGGRLHLPSVVVAAMVTATLVNLAQFPALELELSDWYEAVRVKPGHELPDLVAEHFDSTRARFELYLELREVAPHATVTVPAESAIIDEHLLGLGDAESVVRTDAALTIDASQAAALEPSVVADGYDRDVGDYVIAVGGEGEPTELVLVDGPDHVWLVERALVDALGGGA